MKANQPDLLHVYLELNPTELNEMASQMHMIVS